MNFLPGKKRKPPVRHPEATRKQNVYEKTLGKIGECVSKLGANRFEEAIPQFFETVREFFSSYIPIHYKFTYEELRADIEKKQITPELKKKIRDMLTQLSDAEYHPDGLKKEQLYKLLLVFGEIVELLKEELSDIPVDEHLKEAKWKMLFERFIKPKPNLEAEAHLTQLISQAEKFVTSSDLTNGRQAYDEINKLFESLQEQQKKALYPKIMEIYHRLVALS